ncbi:MAG: hypothetical protein AAF960_13165 [Bacteroidota bacterium]
MNVTEIKARVHRHIDEVDEAFLNVIYAMLETYQKQQQINPVIGFDIDGNPKTANTMRKELKLEVEAAKDGVYTTIEDLKIESEEWLKSTK